MFNQMKENELFRILCLGVCFMLLFASDTAMMNIQKTVVNSIANDQPGFNIDSYTMSGIVFTVFAISVWFGPYINYAIGSKLSMIIAAVGYLCYVASFATECQWLVIAGLVIVGAAAGILWPAQGCYMIENSSSDTTSRNCGVFWVFFTSSNMLGNLCLYTIFYGKKYISRPTRMTAVCTLAGINVLAIIAFILLPKPKTNVQNYEYGPIKSMKKSFSILTSQKMFWMAVVFSYIGIQQSFGQGVYSSTVGFTLAFGDSAKQLVAESGIFFSIGCFVGSLCPVIFAACIRRHAYARRLIVISGVIAQLLCYVITFINLPDKAVFGDTFDTSLIQPRITLAMLGSSLLSYGACCLETQVYSYIGDFYRQHSSEACALYKFFKSVSVAIWFYSSTHLGLHKQVTILAVMAVIGCIGFCVADWVDTTEDQQRTDVKE